MSIFKKILFSQATGIIETGKKRFIQAEDRIEMPRRLSPYNTTFKEEIIDWSSAKKIYLTLFKSAGLLFWTTIFFQVIASCFAFGTPLLVNSFVTSLQTQDWTSLALQNSILLGIGLGVCAAGHGIFIQHYFHGTLNMHQVTINVINKKLFSHSLKLSYLGRQKFQVGDIVNFMSSDAEAIADSTITTVDMANAVVMLLGGSIMLFHFMGWSSLIAVLVMITLIPLTQNLAKKFMHLEEEMMAHRDTRMTIMSQLMSAIRVVKYFSWEKSVENEVNDIREKELSARTRLASAEISWGLIYTSISTVVLFSALLTHYLRGLEITLPLVITAVSIFSMMEHQFGGLSRFISRYINIFVSGKRISDFLKSETLTTLPNVDSNQLSGGLNSDGRLIIENLNFSFSASSPLINNLSLNLRAGQSLAIVGPVGSGKSTLVQILLGEIQKFSGQVRTPNVKSAYVSQESYIVNNTLKENIVFGRGATLDSNADLSNAIYQSCLEADVQLLPAGLDTEIGERGVNLSGGQKQRVSLARAAYSNPEIIYLDDPLSALDPDTEKIVCDRLLFGAWKDKTRIVVTHRLGQLHRFDLILYIEGSGKFIFGTVEEVKKQSIDFQDFLNQDSKNKVSEEIVSEQVNQIEKKVSEGLVIQSESRITVDEDRAIGSVEKSVYYSYIKALGGYSKYQTSILVGMFFMAVLLVTAPMLQKAWLTRAGGTTSAFDLVLIYGLLGIVTLIVTYSNNLLWTMRGIKAGRSFHRRILSSILRTEIRFFDSTPVGRILQRFSRDIESVDIHLQWSFDNTIHSVFHVVVALVLIIFALPIAILFLLPILTIYYFLQKNYRSVAREVKRLDSMARSPRYAHFRETINGLSVIRGFKKSEWFYEQFLQRLDYSTQMFYTHYMVNRWFSVRLPLIGASISAGTACCIAISASQGWISAALGGLVTLYALEFWQHLNWGIRIFSDLESRMTSVERLEFYGHLPSEHDESAVQLSHWPQNGSLEFKNVSLKYADHLPMVLQDISFNIPSGSRVGLIGRTGSGKSTIFQAVYRFVKIQSGDILISNQSILNLPLYQLRSQLAVIPQDPSLFLGTLRSNLDRYHEKSDEAIWSILQKVELFDFVKTLDGQLDFKISESGINLSQGQRQLICLARALLMKVKIIFLDEATASVDIETDAIVQKVIRESLDGITLVTIAHRLSTLSGYDIIIELNQGRVANINNLLINK